MSIISDGLRKLNLQFTSAAEGTNVFELPDSVKSIREKIFKGVFVINFLSHYTVGTAFMIMDGSVHHSVCSCKIEIKHWSQGPVFGSVY